MLKILWRTLMILMVAILLAVGLIAMVENLGDRFILPVEMRGEFGEQGSGFQYPQGEFSPDSPPNGAQGTLPEGLGRQHREGERETGSLFGIFGVLGRLLIVAAVVTVVVVVQKLVRVTLKRPAAPA